MLVEGCIDGSLAVYVFMSGILTGLCLCIPRKKYIFIFTIKNKDNLQANRQAKIFASGFTFRFTCVFVFVPAPNYIVITNKWSGPSERVVIEFTK